MRTPNPEQKKAIEHSGGVVLRAGAGSGKTFVLVEHFIHLMNVFLTDHQRLSEVELQKEIKRYLSSLVFMTFTKKAAAELEIRLQKRLQAEIENAAHAPSWKVVHAELASLTISTIHGFCFKLIAQGFFSNVDPKVTIISEKAQGERIDELTAQWLQGQSDLPSETMRQLLLSQKLLAQSMVRIFSDPETRILWKKHNLAANDISFCDFYTALARELEIENILTPVSMASTAKKAPSYVSVLEQYNEFLAQGRSQLPSQFELIFAGKKLIAPKDNPEVAEYIKSLAEMRKQMKKYADSLKAYYEDEVESCRAWRESLLSLFKYIDQNYLNIKGITFSDLEYYVLDGLNDNEICELIAKNYKYFVVDEYQDTSEIQFQILQRLILKDTQRLFCVGDLKQAIYGFRGGDIGVFRKTMESVAHNFDLKMNYRSSQSVIEFNNSLFAHVMPLGPGLSGRDKHAVLFEKQSVPESCERVGQVQKITYEIERPLEESDNKRWPTNAVLNQLEAQVLMKQISTLVTSDEKASDIAVLYSKLAPSFELISLLMKANKSFNAQVKILSSEDPIMSMTSLLVSLDEESPLLGVLTLMNAYLGALNLEARVTENELQRYLSERSLWGGYESLLRFFWSLGLTNSNFAETFERLHDLYTQSGGNDELFLLKMKEVQDDRYSIDFQYAGEQTKIQIMTAHASKGLEFSQVLLGGIYTNGRKMVSSERIGIDPGSFKWSPKGSKVSSFTTPQFILENKRETLKSFSEAKRLFYVACTRAREGLYWVDLKENSLDVRCESDSWISAFRTWEQDAQGVSDLYNSVVIEQLDVGIEVKSLPFFHYDSLGLYEKTLKSQDLVTLTDLSVTRLATLLTCPRKFYLKNILKFDSLDDFPTLSEDDSLKEFKEQRFENEEELPNIEVTSKIERGLRLHESLHKMIVARNVVALKSDQADVPILKKVSERIAPHLAANKQLYSETQLKFDFFGHMISGIPDLFIIDEKNQELEVWDFKTGVSKEAKDMGYWFQVACYAHALSKKYAISKLKLALYYIDSDQFKTIEISAEQNDRFLSNIWKRIYNLDQVNTEHCSVCEFGKICQGQGTCVAPVKLSDMI